MKTPMQELIEIIKKRQEDDEAMPFMYNDKIIKLAESILEKEKEIKQMTKQRFIDTYFKKYKWYRRLVGGTWYKHQFTRDAQELCISFVGTWWARYNQINRYSKVIKIETYGGNK
jgi:hypothetical protein